ncbi:MAG: ketopantoate reductase family protein [Polyangiaceae bacterium]|nr:ketopantoate reductase family protein [Polyangiaceae bacterium]
MRWLLVGCGGLGGVIAGHLRQETRTDLTVLTTNGEVRSVLARSGLTVRDGRRSFTVALRVTGDLASTDLPFDVVVLATPPTAVEAAVRSVAPWLAVDGRVVCLQNGLCEERVARIVGVERVIGAVVFFGASMPLPGVAERTSAGGFALGKLVDDPDPLLPLIADRFRALGAVRTTTNLRGMRWTKLAVNCAMSTFGTIGGEPVGVLMQRYDARQLGIEAISEAVQVARAEGVRLERPGGAIDLGWLLVDRRAQSSRFSPGLLLRHLLVLGAVTPYRRLRSSMLAAIERGREPPVDYLNGEVIERAAAYGISVPVNAAARDLVWAIARGEAQPSVATLMDLYARTR